MTFVILLHKLMLQQRKWSGIHYAKPGVCDQEAEPHHTQRSAIFRPGLTCASRCVQRVSRAHTGHNHETPRVVRCRVSGLN